MNIPGLSPAINKILDVGLIGAFLIVALAVIAYLLKVLLSVEDKRVGDGIDREKTITIALDTVTQKIASFDKTLQDVDNTIKSVKITLENKNDKS